MKPLKILFIISLVLLTKNYTSAQTITIPDPEFATWIQTNYPTCISGDQLDTICLDGLDITSVVISSTSIANLSGLEYFREVTSLYVGGNSLLTTLNNLPPNLDDFTCNNNSLLTTPPLLPNSITWLSFSYSYFNIISSLPSSLKTFHCDNSSTTSITALPNGLHVFNCSNSPLVSLPVLPISLKNLNCSAIGLSFLPALNDSLEELYCDYNILTSLPALPASLKILICQSNQLTALPALPLGLTDLGCRYNMITSLPSLPVSLKNLECSDNLLTTLPNVTSGQLQMLLCNNNQLTELPYLVEGLLTLQCENNLLTDIPNLPNSLGSIYLTNNPGLNCLPNIPIYLAGIGGLYDGGTGITCYPNYSINMNSSISKPLCLPDDPINNPNDCPGFVNIYGHSFYDIDEDCLKDTNDFYLKNIRLNLLDSAGNYLQSLFTTHGDSVAFNTRLGLYTIEMDTLPDYLTTTCPISQDIEYLLSPPTDTAMRFGLTCNFFDTGIKSIVPAGWVFPGEQHQLFIQAGDLSQFYGVSCADSMAVSSTITVTATGPVHYVGPASFALTPTSVVGNTLTYSISSFDTTDIFTSFNSVFETDTTAIAGDTVCINVSIANSITGDLDLTNNSYSYCYPVINSYDPNIKLVNHELVAPGFSDDLVYTIYFQNTGNAPAFNIRLEDTLDAALDLETFEVLNYSHSCKTTLNHTSRKLVVKFDYILLPDSATNPQGSIGFIQYKIKPIVPMVNGDQIKNTAHIIFDYNAPIITNTATTVAGFLGEHEILTNSDIIVYPNPTTDYIYINSSKGITCNIYTLYGTKIMESLQLPIDVSTINTGVYLLEIKLNNQRWVKKITKF